MSTAVVLGGGISGLSACYYLQKSGQFSKVLLFESSNRLGGWIKTINKEDGGSYELGPRSLRPVGESGKNTLILAEELGLYSHVIGVPREHPAAKNRFIYCNGKVNALPNRFSSLFSTNPPFSKPLYGYLQSEVWKRNGTKEDESIYDFISRRFGNDIADHAVDPLCRGIFAGDCRELSIKSCLPLFYNLERDHGGVVWGMFKTLLSKKKDSEQKEGRLVAKAKEEKWASYSFTKGMSQLPSALETLASENPCVEIVKNSPCTSINFDNGKIVVEVNGEKVTADHVFSSLFSQDMAKVLPLSLRSLSVELQKIPAVNTVVVCLELEGHVEMGIPGFGHLLPSFEDGKTLGVIYDSCTFPDHDRLDCPATRFTVMLGGAWFNDLKSAVPSMSKEDLGRLAKETLFRHLGINPEHRVLRQYVEVLHNCIPQYILGHSSVLKTIEEDISSRKLPLSLIGSSYKGVSLNDCINNSRLEVEKVTGMPSSYATYKV